MRKIIIIAHQGHENADITQNVCEAAVKNIFPDASTEFVDVNIWNGKLGNTDIPFDQIRFQQTVIYQEQIKPLLEQYPNSVIAYFGFAPIAAIVHLGFLFPDTCEKLYFQRNHDTKQWYYDIEPVIDFQIKPQQFEQGKQKGEGDVIVRISTSNRIQKEDTTEVLESRDNLLKEYDFELEATHKTAYTNQKQYADSSEKIRAIFDDIANTCPKVDTIHLFIASGCGLPFLIGSLINPNIVKKVQTYQYNANGSPCYIPAILLKFDTNEKLIYSQQEQNAAQELRASWKKELHGSIRGLINSNKDQSFAETIMGKKKKNFQQYSKDWEYLPNIDKVSLLNDSIDLTENDVNDGFDYDETNNTWKLGDSFLVPLSARKAKGANLDLAMAGRLFLLHESLHYSPNGHSITKGTATGIGRFAKVIEKADYQADVWAILNEYKIQLNTGLSNSDLKRFFLNAIDTATETMWSFLNPENCKRQFPIRSAWRFTNWYWQYARIEMFDSSKNMSIDDVLDILLDMPTIEFSGGNIFTENNRTYFKLDEKSIIWEISLLHKGKIKRFSPIEINNLIDGFKATESSRIKGVFKNMLSQI